MLKGNISHINDNSVYNFSEELDNNGVAQFKGKSIEVSQWFVCSLLTVEYKSKYKKDILV